MAECMGEIEDLDLGKIESDQVLNQLECPVCYDYIIPPVKQCIKGHLICSSCFQKLKPATCPTCRSDLSQERNLAVEKIAYLLKYPCRYSLSGCKQFFLLPQKDFHERNCQYLLVKCPFMIKNGKCKYNGTLKNTEDHLKTDHKITAVSIREDGMYFYKCKGFSRRQTGPSLEGERSLPQVWRQIWVFLFKWDGYMFRFIVKKVNSKQIGRGDNDSKIKDFIISHIQFVGVESLAGKYAYIITIFEAKSRKRSHELQGIVTSTLNSTIEECVKNSSNCGLVLPYLKAKDFVDENGNLGFIINMKKLQPVLMDDTEISRNESQQPANKRIRLDNNQ